VPVLRRRTPRVQTDTVLGRDPFVAEPGRGLPDERLGKEDQTIERNLHASKQDAEREDEDGPAAARPRDLHSSSLQPRALSARGNPHLLALGHHHHGQQPAFAGALHLIELRAAPGKNVRLVRRGITFAPSAGMPVVLEKRAA